MKLKLTLNIGTVDAKRLELTKTHEGDVVTVSQTVGDELLKRGWAVTEDGKQAAVAPAVIEPPVANSAPTPTESPRPAKGPNKP